MNVQIEPGIYVVAVSGGVDSMALLHRLQQLTLEDSKSRRFIVAHFDHGIREDSVEDRKLVQATAHDYGLPFVYDTATLGPSASEAEARDARYAFLHRVRQASGARAIITAHHQDDVLETAILNMIRGTDRRGLTAVLSNPRVHRPLTHLPKSVIYDYAREQGLVWHEDSTNQDLTYKRNYIRHKVLPRLSHDDRQRFMDIITNLHRVNQELDGQLVNVLHMQPESGTFSRQLFTQLPHKVARESLAQLLRAKGVRQYDRRMLDRLTVAAKVARHGSQFPITNGWYLTVQPQILALVPPER
jgi:tRNA(Ile)-lysidine synthase